MHEELLLLMQRKSSGKTLLAEPTIRRGMEIFIEVHNKLSLIPPLVDVKPTKMFVGLWAKCDRKRIICSAYKSTGFSFWELYPDFNIPRKRQIPVYLDNFKDSITKTCMQKQKLGIYARQRGSSGGYLKVMIPDMSWHNSTTDIDELMIDLALATYAHLSSSGHYVSKLNAKSLGCLKNSF